MCSSSIRVDSSVSQSPERLHPRPSFAVRGWHEQRDLDRYSSLHHIACNNPPMGCPSYVPRTNQSPVPLYYHVPATTDFFFFSVPFQYYPLCVSEGGESLHIYVAGDYDDNDSDGDGTWHQPTATTKDKRAVCMACWWREYRFFRGWQENPWFFSTASRDGWRRRPPNRIAALPSLFRHFMWVLLLYAGENVGVLWFLIIF